MLRISCGLTASPLFLPQCPPESLWPSTAFCCPIVACRCFQPEIWATCSKPGALQSTQDNPGGFWDGRGFLWRLPAFPMVSILLPSANLNIPLSPCGTPMPTHDPPTPPCSPVFSGGCSLREIQAPYFKAWCSMFRPGQSRGLLVWDRPPWEAPNSPCSLTISPSVCLKVPLGPCGLLTPLPQ